MGFNIDNGVLTKYYAYPVESKITIPDGVKSIGPKAFYACESVTSITIPDSVKRIGTRAFYSCERLTSITIPDGVTRITERAFAHCSNLTSVKLSGGLETIGKGAFKYCYSLTNIVIPDRVIQIGDEAFLGCDKLASINIPDSVINIGDCVFSGCDSLTTVVAKPSIFKDRELKHTVVLTFLRIPEAFSAEQAEDCKKYLCSNKQQLLPEIFSKDLVYAMQVFSDSGRITINNLDSVFLKPAIEANATQCVAFLMDWENKNVSIEDREKLMEKEFNKDPFNAADMKKIWSYKKLEDGTLSLTSYKNTDTNVVIPARIGKNNVTCLSDNLFSVEMPGRRSAQREVLENITSVTIQSGIIRIGKSAFRGCRELQVVTIPETVKVISAYAFLHCSTSLTIHAPEGSFAAKYAKNHGISLVTE